MTELRKCPFCGGEAEVWVSNVTDRAVIYCKVCDAQIMKPNEQEAIEAWNKRVGDANKTIENVITCGECVYFKNGECTSEEVASDDEGGACFSCSRSEDDYCSFGWKGKIN